VVRLRVHFRVSGINIIIIGLLGIGLLGEN
jgi:hypothetical protein